MEHMILADRIWQDVRKWYTEDQRIDIHLAQVGTPTVQKGITIDLAQLTPFLRAKLRLDFEPQPARVGRGAGNVSQPGVPPGFPRQPAKSYP